jgi:predicted DCC family thiol-disulfide oxidoreductase YuxK
MNKSLNKIEFTLLYDGLCPLCSKEVAWLYIRNKQEKLGFQDINAVGFDPTVYGKTHDELMAEIHGFYPDGQIIKGMGVFRETYKAVGLGWLMAATGWPVLKPLFDLIYKLFAKYRVPLARLVAGEKSCDCGK